MKIRILPSAIADLDQGRRFYEAQAAGVGRYFLDTLISDIDSLAIYAGIHMQVFGYHRPLSKRFPYAYRLENDTCLIFRVLDCRQSPPKTTLALR